ncbi:hypothetical protein ABEB36_002355 [Hypothenemus hampei]|uniref:E3 ubiquitin-protein ligase Topors n=1 Tax=Hypothenemus hampei TaxID=57062 RepID=A0ABD1F631_HYPHA
MAEAKVPINRPSSASTPPNCAICLGGCMNKCFSNSCMHQFCFQCLKEWSKIKAECPLCKQPFKSIIHNVKSNVEYEEHIVEVPSRRLHATPNGLADLAGLLDVNARDLDYVFENPFTIPSPPAPLQQRHEFHVRTTVTVDSRGEHAIQQMLLAHPLTIGGRITVNAGLPNPRTTLIPFRHRRDYSATSFRRSVYTQNLWASPLPDIFERFRDCSPVFYRNNPSTRHRLVPWLNRELNALLYENTQLVMHLVDLIMDNLLRYHICSRTFRNMLREYLNNKTDQFVHEFHIFMRSPYDMFGYDMNVQYTSRTGFDITPILDDETVEIPDNSDDSDVVLVGESNLAEPITIDLLESNDSDEPILVSTNNEIPMPIPATSNQPFMVRPPTPAAVNLPLKLRYKQGNAIDRERSRSSKKRHCVVRSSSTSSSSCNERSKRESYRKYKKRKLKKQKTQTKYKVFTYDRTTPDVDASTNSDTEDNRPLIDIIREAKRKCEKNKRKQSHSRPLAPLSTDSYDYQNAPLDLSTPTCSRIPSSSSSNEYRTKFKLTVNNGDFTSVKIETSGNLPDAFEASTSKTKIKVRNEPNSSSASHYNRRDSDVESDCSTEPYQLPAIKSEIREVKHENPGPSTSKASPLVLRRYKTEQDKWYIFGDSDSSD